MPDFGKYGKHFHSNRKRSSASKRLHINVINSYPTVWYWKHQKCHVDLRQLCFCFLFGTAHYSANSDILSFFWHFVIIFIAWKSLELRATTLHQFKDSMHLCDLELRNISAQKQMHMSVTPKGSRRNYSFTCEVSTSFCSSFLQVWMRQMDGIILKYNLPICGDMEVVL